MRVGITVTHIMVHTTIDRKLQDVLDRTDPQIGRRDNPLPVFLIIPSLDDLISFQIFLVHDSVRLILISAQGIHVKQTFAKLVIQFRIITHIRLQVGITPLYLQGIDHLVNRTQLTQRRSHIPHR